MQQTGVNTWRTATTLWTCASLILVTVCWWYNFNDFDLIIAVRGHTPVSWIYLQELPENFTRNFPNLVNTYGTSLPLHLFKLANYIGVGPEEFLPIFLFLEIIVLYFSCAFLCKTLITEYKPVYPFIMVCLVVASNGLNINFARFHWPFFFALYYNFATAAQIVGICFALRSRFFLSATFFVLSMASHPILGAFGVLAAGIGLLFFPAQEKIKTILGALLYCVIAIIPWILFTYNFSSTGSIPNETWFEMTEMLSYHWYPISMGIFGARGWEKFFPFLSLSLLFVCFFLDKNKISILDRRVLAAILLVIPLTIFGILFSLVHLSPTLTMLALHRYNSVAVWLMLPYVVAGLVSRFSSSSFVSRILSIGIVLSPFLLNPGYPLLLTLLFAGNEIREGRGNLTIKVALAAVASLGGFYLYLYGEQIFKYDVFSGTTFFWKTLAVISVCILLLRSVSPKKAELLFGAAVACAAGYWLVTFSEQRPFLPQSQVNFAKGYKEAQLWVRENTDISALFFPEPTTFHGWRAYAQRSSFGTIFEWLADSWLYNRDFPLFTEGQKRFAEFGINLKDYYEQPGNVAGKLAKAASEIYYSSDDSWRLSIAERYGIDYFVMKKELMVRKIDLPVAFENEQVVIYKVEQLH